MPRARLFGKKAKVLPSDNPSDTADSALVTEGKAEEKENTVSNDETAPEAPTTASSQKANDVELEVVIVPKKRGRPVTKKKVVSTEETSEPRAVELASNEIIPFDSALLTDKLTTCDETVVIAQAVEQEVFVDAGSGEKLEFEKPDLPSAADFHEFTYEQLFYQLFVYKTSHGNTRVPLDYTVTVDNKSCPLGLWAEHIRIRYPQGASTIISSTESVKNDECSSVNLTEDQRKALNSIGFLWEWSATAAASLARRKRDTPDSATTETKKNYKRIKKIRSRRLPSADTIWDEMYQRLCIYHSRFGHCHIPPTFDEGELVTPDNDFPATKEMSVRSWVARQRSLFKGTAIAHGKPYVLRADRREKLESLGFQQYVTAGSLELSKLESPVVFPNRTKTIVPPVTSNSTDTTTEHATDSVEDASELPRLNVTNSMGGYKTRSRKDWHEYYMDLKEYKEQNGDCNVPQFWDVDRKLGKWVAKQRYQYNLKMRNEKTQLTDERMALLTALDFNWGGIRVGIRSSTKDAPTLSADNDFSTDDDQHNGIGGNSTCGLAPNEVDIGDEIERDEAVKEAVDKAKEVSIDV